MSRPADVPIPRRDEWEIAGRDLPLAQPSRWFVASGRHDNPLTRSPGLARPDHHRRDRGRRELDFPPSLVARQGQVVRPSRKRGRDRREGCPRLGVRVESDALDGARSGCAIGDVGANHGCVSGQPAITAVARSAVAAIEAGGSSDQNAPLAWKVERDRPAV